MVCTTDQIFWCLKVLSVLDGSMQLACCHLGRISPRLKESYTLSQIRFNSTFSTVGVEDENGHFITELHKDVIFAKISVHYSAISVSTLLSGCLHTTTDFGR